MSPGRARLATLDPVLQSFGQGNTRTHFATGDQPWGQPSPILRQIPIKLSSRGAAGRGLAGARPLLSPLRQADAGISFGTGEPEGGRLIVQGEQVTLLDKNGATLGSFEFEGRDIQKAVQEVLDSHVPRVDEAIIAGACGEQQAESVSNTSIMSALWDSQSSATSGGQTAEKHRIASFIFSKNEIYDCQTKEYTSSIFIYFAHDDGSTSIQGIGVKSSPSSPLATPTPTVKPTTRPTAIPTVKPTQSSVSIGGASCTFVSRYDITESLTTESFDVVISGTATGPVGDVLVMGLSGKLFPLRIELTSAWTPFGPGAAKREPGDPETTAWTARVSVESQTPDAAGSFSFGGVQRAVTRVTCPWEE